MDKARLVLRWLLIPLWFTIFIAYLPVLRKDSCGTGKCHCCRCTESPELEHGQQDHH